MQKKIYPRWIQDNLKKALKSRRVLLLSGPRQCGKTTLAKTLLSEEITYRTLDDITLLEAARKDPISFVKHNSKTLIIDEVQHAPQLLSAIKKQVDENNHPGQFLLTGSSNIQSLPNVNESLAGRIRNIRLRTLTRGELSGKKPEFIQNAFKENFPSNNAPDDRDELLKKALQGGFPEALKLDNSDRKTWHRDYINALLERDLRDIANIKHINAMKELLLVLAAWSSRFMDISSIGSGLSIKRPTVESYINALEALYLVERVYPWTKTDYERVSKSPKMFFTDCGLMSSILSWKLDNIYFNSDRIGKLTETLVFNELAANIDFSEGKYELYHYRDREKREIDFLIEREDGALLGIEVKASATAHGDDFKHLKWFKNNLAHGKTFIGIVLYTGENIVPFGDSLWAVPIQYMYSD